MPDTPRATARPAMSERSCQALPAQPLGLAQQTGDLLLTGLRSPGSLRKTQGLLHRGHTTQGVADLTAQQVGGARRAGLVAAEEAEVTGGETVGSIPGVHR